MNSSRSGRDSPSISASGEAGAYWPMDSLLAAKRNRRRQSCACLGCSSSAWGAVQAIPVGLRKIDIRSALEIAVRHRIHAYDAYFIECALSLRSPLLTLDQGLSRVAYDLDIELLE